ncbi:LysR family transcriptional regulator [Kurthia zopfii]|uniref:DNA-binding transcriptional LysR family regulator n=2 Tax=Kurthia zopfii TaxID=1650 RepID=A0A8B4QCH6_9BACL|nr:LysR family transcriptional regulator [Kurthia zopfii]PWI21190.1 LysR family transcriptional regulator [Kurthia zopfii]TDR33301.1 DNA-binding transcriptional LysR family regulator [Kurthia zopfii]STX10399.1 HTH-type transcriptional activator CmpR [Kurthia zopfii]
MSILKLKAYIAAVKFGSLTKAAEALDYTQPSISHMIHSLEDDYGFSLLIRSKSGVTPTDNGAELLPIMQDIVNRYEHLSEAVYAIHGLDIGTVRLGAYTSVCVHWMPSLLKEFREQFPKIEIHLFEGNSDEIHNWLEEGHIDFAISTIQRSEEFHFLPLVEDRMMAILPRNHPLSKNDTVPIEVFAEERCIIPYEDTHKDVQRIFKKAKVKPNVAYQIRGDEAIIAMVKKGLGISLLSELLITDHFQDMAHLPLAPDHVRTLGITTKTEIKSLSPASRTFIPFLQQWLKK